MLNLFKRSKNTTTEQANTSPQAQTSGIPFYENLISDLKDDHQQLDIIYNDVIALVEKNKIEKAAARLKDYGALLKSHLLTENMRLYIYLQQKVADDAVNTQLVRAFRKEMDGIAMPVLNFLDRYANSLAIKNSLLEFTQEFRKINDSVHERMQREEQTLYPLYN